MPRHNSAAANQKHRNYT